jgi:hypothetical protein
VELVPGNDQGLSEPPPLLRLGFSSGPLGEVSERDLWGNLLHLDEAEFAPATVKHVGGEATPLRRCPAVSAG